MRLALSFALLAVGCSYGPEHLDSLYIERDTVDGRIRAIERDHNLRSRDPERQAREEEIKREKIASLQRQEDAVLGAVKEEADFLAGLTTEQRLAWMMHRDRISAEVARLSAEERNAKANRELEMDLFRRQVLIQALSGNPVQRVEIDQTIHHRP